MLKVIHKKAVINILIFSVIIVAIIAVVVIGCIIDYIVARDRIGDYIVEGSVWEYREEDVVITYKAYTEGTAPSIEYKDSKRKIKWRGGHRNTLFIAMIETDTTDEIWHAGVRASKDKLTLYNIKNNEYLDESDNEKELLKYRFPKDIKSIQLKRIK